MPNAHRQADLRYDSQLSPHPFRACGSQQPAEWIVDWIQVVSLALVQGFTEFLPVSSSAHLVLMPVLLGWRDQGLAFDVALHIGTLVAVVWYFRRELADMTRAWIDSLLTRRLTSDAKLAWAVLLGTIPVGLAGLIFKDVVETHLRSPVVLACGLIVFGLVLAWADMRRHASRDLHEMTWKDVAFIACAQALALIPGTSRSGITLTAGLFAGMSRQAAARFSFLLSIPVIVLAGGLETIELINTPHEVDWLALSVGTLLAAISAYLCIRLFLALIQRIGMWPFVVYRIVLGIALLALFS